MVPVKVTIHTSRFQIKTRAAQFSAAFHQILSTGAQYSTDMDFSPTNLHLMDSTVPQQCNILQQWGYPDSEGYCSLSPTSSIDSASFSPPYQSCAFPNETTSSLNISFSQMEMLKSKPSQLPLKKDHRKRKVYSQRHSASEREKMRMRNLSTSLQNLRKYLPPAVAPIGKGLTKIEILRLTIRYISHLSEVLGLDEETLIMRREQEMRRSNMCHLGLCCCQDKMHNLCPQPKHYFSETASSTHLTRAPRLFPEQNIFEAKNKEIQQPTEWLGEGMADLNVTFPSCAMAPIQVHDTVSSEMKEEFALPSLISPDQGFSQNFIDNIWDELQEKDLWSSFQIPEIVPHPAY